jgi:hypothetical protein
MLRIFAPRQYSVGPFDETAYVRDISHICEGVRSPDCINILLAKRCCALLSVYFSASAFFFALVLI